MSCSSKQNLSKASTNSFIPLSETTRPTKIKTKSLLLTPSSDFNVLFSKLENNSESKYEVSIPLELPLPIILSLLGVNLRLTLL